MRVPRVFCDQPLSADAEVVLDPQASHHLLRVLRLAVGSAVRVCDGRGSEYEARVVVAASPLRVRLGRPIETRTESPLAVTVAQAVAKGERMDYALQKCVELGVSAIQPLFTVRSVVRLDGPRLHRREAHWQGVLRSACEQSGRVRLPTLHPARSLRDWFDQDPARGADALQLDPRAELGLNRVRLASDRVLLLIGPEGGLDPDEIAAASAAGFRSVRLGPRVLRTETAATVALSVLQARFGDLA